jgi:hypothetical protein
MSIILAGILFGIGLILAPLVFRLAIIAIGALLGGLVVCGAIMLIVNAPVWAWELFIVLMGATVIPYLARRGSGALGRIFSEVGSELRAQRRARDIAAMREHFADEMAARLRREGYYLPRREHDHDGV